MLLLSFWAMLVTALIWWSWVGGLFDLPWIRQPHFAPLGHPEDTNMVPYLQVEDTKASENWKKGYLI